MLQGHFWTVRRHFFDRPPSEIPTREVAFVTEDDSGARHELSGRFCEPGGRDLLVVTHGLGGSHASIYMQRTLAAAWDQQLDCLLLNQRGVDLRGGDLYHGGLYQDIAAVLADARLGSYTRLFVLGYSLGGNVALLAAGRPIPRLCAVAAICPPLDLGACSLNLDLPRHALYRWHMLRSLHAHYHAVARLREVPVPWERARRIWHFRDWDEWIVAPWFGFSGRADYYARASAGPRLTHLGVPALIVTADGDPMVPRATTDPWLARSDKFEHWRLQGGGHVAFPKNVDFHQPGPPGLEPQVLAWLLGQRSATVDS